MMKLFALLIVLVIGCAVLYIWQKHRPKERRANLHGLYVDVAASGSGAVTKNFGLYVPEPSEPQLPIPDGLK